MVLSSLVANLAIHYSLLSHLHFMKVTYSCYLLGRQRTPLETIKSADDTDSESVVHDLDDMGLGGGEEPQTSGILQSVESIHARGMLCQ